MLSFLATDWLDSVIDWLDSIFRFCVGCVARDNMSDLEIQRNTYMGLELHKQNHF